MLGTSTMQEVRITTVLKYVRGALGRVRAK
ncbi:MAG: hypothetical protein QOG55_1432 [Acidobacteriaceae bacterium]|jgi:hypothetical protein|nr:hypothetical protein [Acidobacteriaceae bacterium]